MAGEHEMVAAACGDAHQTRSGWLRVFCPLCAVRVGKQDRRRSLSVHPGDWFYRCWRCNASGKLPRAPDGTEHLDGAQVDLGDVDLGPPEGFMPIAEGPALYAESTLVVRQYLSRRRVTRRVCAEIGIGVCFRGYAGGRIVVPVHRPGAVEWSGWVGRAWDNSVDLRYLYPSGMPRGELMFNAQALQVETDVPALVVEGVFDALPHWPDVAACLGKPGEGHIDLMVAARRPLLVALDGDAWTEAEALAMRLHLEGKQAEFLHLPPRTDPGDYRRTELLRMDRLAAV